MHLLKRSSGYPKKTEGTLGGRKTQRRNQLQVAYTRSTESLTSIEPIFFVVAMNRWSIKEKFFGPRIFLLNNIYYIYLLSCMLQDAYVLMHVSGLTFLEFKVYYPFALLFAYGLPP